MDQITPIEITGKEDFNETKEGKYYFTHWSEFYKRWSSFNAFITKERTHFRNKDTHYIFVKNI